MKNLYIIGGILLGVLGITSLATYQKQVRSTYRAEEFDTYNLYYDKYENECLAFVKMNNLIEQQEVDTLSVVLYMEYARKNEFKKEFDQYLRFIENYLMQEDGLIMGKVHNKVEVGAANNAYETMRLMSILMEAYEVWGDTSYRDYALHIEKSLYDKNVNGKNIYSLYNTVTKKTDTDIELSALRLKSMIQFEEYRNEWKSIYQESKQLMQKAYISDQFPLYKSIYNTKDCEYVAHKTINMQDSLQIVLNLAEVGLVREETIIWIKNAVKQGAIFTEYDLTTGKATGSTEEPSIYAIVAQIGKILGDNELYT
ncbi:MAG: hypothetical protein ACRCTE_14455, partial [Cellulosilyticaceae bacterium]